MGLPAARVPFDDWVVVKKKKKNDLFLLNKGWATRVLKQKQMDGFKKTNTTNTLNSLPIRLVSIWFFFLVGNKSLNVISVIVWHPVSPLVRFSLEFVLARANNLLMQEMEKYYCRLLEVCYWCDECQFPPWRDGDVGELVWSHWGLKLTSSAGLWLYVGRFGLQETEKAAGLIPSEKIHLDFPDWLKQFCFVLSFFLFFLMEIRSEIKFVKLNLVLLTGDCISWSAVSIIFHLKASLNLIFHHRATRDKDGVSFVSMKLFTQTMKPPQYVSDFHILVTIDRIDRYHFIYFL